MRTIAVVTVARSDYSIYRPILRRLEHVPNVMPELWVCGAHLSPEMGMTVCDIEADGFPIHARMEFLLSSDSPYGMVASAALAQLRFAEQYTRSRPDMLLVIGDRLEMMAAVTAALPFRIPVAHLHGGELTQGALDDCVRHAVTKCSHLHFVATERYAQRLIQMGEEPWRITVSGAPSLDNLKTLKLLSRHEFLTKFEIPDGPFVLVTYHPETLAAHSVTKQVDELLAALEHTEFYVLFTAPNSDTGAREIRDQLRSYVAQKRRRKLLTNLGPELYFSAMRHAAAMVGNSSSGILETPSFALPVVNIGRRQDGRVRAPNIIDVACDCIAISDGIRRATSTKFRQSLQGLVNPYGDGNAAERIVDILASFALDERLLIKRFEEHPLPLTTP